MDYESDLIINIRVGTVMRAQHVEERLKLEATRYCHSGPHTFGHVVKVLTDRLSSAVSECVVHLTGRVRDMMNTEREMSG